MEKRPIEALMGTTMESIKDMVDVNTVVGDPVQAADGTTIIPVSRVSFGFAAGGGEYGVGQGKAPAQTEELPFAGGSGAGGAAFWWRSCGRSISSTRWWRC